MAAGGRFRRASSWLRCFELRPITGCLRQKGTFERELLSDSMEARYRHISSSNYLLRSRRFTDDTVSVIPVVVWGLWCSLQRVTNIKTGEQEAGIRVALTCGVALRDEAELPGT